MLTRHSGAILIEQNDLAHTLSQVTKLWYKTVDALNKKLFDGSDDSIKSLGGMMADGKLLERGNTISDPTIQSFLEKAIFGILIPQAWVLGQSYPFILNSGYPCGTVAPTMMLLTEDVGSVTWSCVDDKLYYLVAPDGDASTCLLGGDGLGAAPCYATDWSAPVGLATMDGTAWGGVTRDDFIAG